jgi:hypothetical protein
MTAMTKEARARESWLRRAFVEFRKRASRVFLASASVFTANRRIADDQLMIDGQPARWTAVDRARFKRNQSAIDKAQTALDAACAEMAKPYPLAHEVGRLIGGKLDRAAAVVGSGLVALFGGAVAAFGAWQIAQPDEVLFEHALRHAQHAAPPSVSDERGFLLGVMACGVALLIWGCLGVSRWWQQRSAG